MEPRIVKVLVSAAEASDRDYFSLLLRQAGLDPHATMGLDKIAADWLDQPGDLVLVVHRPPDDPRSLEARIRDLRRTTQVPIVLLSESAREIDIARHLEAGADVALSLPAPPRVLVAYLNNLLRRSRNVPLFTLPVLEAGEIRLNPSTREIESGSLPAQRLTQLEFRLLYLLMTNRGQVIPSEVIVEHVWGYSDAGSRELVRGLVSRLRAKIEPDPSNPRFIRTVSGVGYLFDSKLA